jgi:catechol 2,3-dioxygenase-like lactoylglutathione lyase family enzyme
MTRPAKPHIECEQHHATLSVSDVRAAVEFYTTKLGFTLAFAEGDPPRFAGINLGRVQIFLARGAPAPQGCSIYFVVGDADALFEFHRANGVDIAEVPRDQSYGLREYTVRDLEGYYLNFGHRLRGSAE